MNIIPVEVQLPCQPKTRRIVGKAPDYYTAGEVATMVGIPAGFLIDGKIIRRGGKMRWSLVTNVMNTGRPV
jgi:hypothetical protein